MIIRHTGIHRQSDRHTKYKKISSRLVACVINAWHEESEDINVDPVMWCAFMIRLQYEDHSFSRVICSEWCHMSVLHSELSQRERESWKRERERTSSVLLKVASEVDNHKVSGVRVGGGGWLQRISSGDRFSDRRREGCWLVLLLFVVRTLPKTWNLDDAIKDWESSQYCCCCRVSSVNPNKGYFSVMMNKPFSYIQSIEMLSGTNRRHLDILTLKLIEALKQLERGVSSNHITHVFFTFEKSIHFSDCEWFPRVYLESIMKTWESSHLRTLKKENLTHTQYDNTTCQGTKSSSFLCFKMSSG